MAVAPSLRSKRKHHTLTWVMVSVLLILIAAAIFWWTRRGQTEASVAAPTTVTVAPESYRITVAGPGTLAAAGSFDVTTSIGGTVASVAAVGERVTAGQVVAQLEPGPLERAVRDAELALQKAEAQVSGLAANQASSDNNLAQNIANAEAELANAQRTANGAEADLNLAKQLFAIGSESAEAVSVAQDSYDSASAALASAQRSLDTLRASQGYQATSNGSDMQNAQLAVAQARLSLEDAQDDLAATAITSPIGGVIVSVNAQAGGKVFAEGTLLTLIDDTTIDLAAQVDETQIGQVQVGQTADVTLDAFADRTFTGTVTAISPEAIVESNIPIFDVTVQLDNPDLALRPGMTAEAEIVVRQVDNAVTLPLAALQTRAGRGAARGANSQTSPGTPASAGAPTVRSAGAGNPGADNADADNLDADSVSAGNPGASAAGAGAAGAANTQTAAPATPPVRNADAAPRQRPGGPPTGALEGATVAPSNTATVVQVQQADGSYQPVPVEVVDTMGLNAVVVGLQAGAVVLVPDSSAVSATTTNNARQQGGFPLGGGGPPAGGFGGGRP